MFLEHHRLKRLELRSDFGFPKFIVYDFLTQHLGMVCRAVTELDCNNSDNLLIQATTIG